MVWIGLWLTALLPLLAAATHAEHSFKPAATPANLYTGQQFDPDLGLYYLRARYHNPDSGRFWTADAFEGFASDPASLHRYTYCHNNPVNAVDPSGYSASMAEGMSVLGLGPTVTGALLATSLGVLSRGAGAISGGAGFMDSVEAAITGAPTEAAINLVGGALGVGLLKGAGHLMQTYLPLLAPEATVALSRAFAAMGRSWGAVEASFAQLQSAIRAGPQEAVIAARTSFTQAYSQASRLAEVISQLRAILGWGEASIAGRAGVLMGRLEANAAGRLAQMESANPGAHFLSRHGAATTIEQQFIRATTGVTPDGVAGRIVNSSRFLSNRAQLAAAERANAVFSQTGQRSFSFEMSEIGGAISFL